jgi:hypothetical protein
MHQGDERNDFVLPCDTRLPFVCETRPWWVRRYDGHVYRLFLSDVSWATAKAECERAGAHLVTFGDEEEQDFVASRVNQTVWMGAHEPVPGPERQFRWVTGEPLAFRHFGPDEPDAITDNCAVMGPQGWWHDRPCSEAHGFVCEIGR